MEKLNIAEILKDCPKGMELDCTMFENLKFEKVDNEAPIYPIICYTTVNGDKVRISFTKYGNYNNCSTSKCVIFPKGKTTWEGFQRPFKDGDILYIDCNDDGDTYEQYQYIFILKQISEGKIDAYCYVDGTNESRFKICYLADLPYHPRFATEEEKQKLFKAIKDNGYKWNAETKTLEKLEKEKFDITTLKPFDKVLVRQNVYGKWGIDFFGYYNKGNHRTTGSCIYKQCVPYEGNEHLLGTTNDCDEYYKTWE